MSRRASNHIEVAKKYTRENINVRMNSALFEWVIENLSKNAMDAMAGNGVLSFEVNDVPGKVLIDVSDTGKGIPHKNFNSVFMPGYTTKKRGWGLGLSLAKTHNRGIPPRENLCIVFRNRQRHCVSH